MKMSHAENTQPFAVPAVQARSNDVVPLVTKPVVPIVGAVAAVSVETAVLAAEAALLAETVVGEPAHVSATVNWYETPTFKPVTVVTTVARVVKDV